MNDADELRTYSGDKLIRKAIALLRSKHPEVAVDMSEYDIRAWDTGGSVIVCFERLIRCYSDQNERFDITVDLVQERIDPFDSFGPENFHITTASDNKLIEFAKRIIPFPDGFITEIRENDTTVFVNFDNKWAFARYEINKRTATENRNSLQGSYVQLPEDIAGPEWIQIV